MFKEWLQKKENTMPPPAMTPPIPGNGPVGQLDGIKAALATSKQELASVKTAMASAMQNQDPQALQHTTMSLLAVLDRLEKALQPGV
jgi:hypothetical protein